MSVREEMSVHERMSVRAKMSVDERMSVREKMSARRDIFTVYTRKELCKMDVTQRGFLALDYLLELLGDLHYDIDNDERALLYGEREETESDEESVE